MTRHRSPQGRGAHRMPPPPGPVLAAGAGGAHRPVDSSSASRRGLVAAGGAAVLVGQVTFSQATTDGGTPLLPDPASLIGLEPTELTITQLSAASPLASAHEGFEPLSLAAETQQADADKLTKAAGLVEAARAAEAARAGKAERAGAAAAARRSDLPSVRGSRCAPNRLGFGAVKSWVSTSGAQLRCIFGVSSVGGVASRAGVSDHPRGLALDFMTNRATGDELAAYALKYMGELKIKYVIWKQRINYGNGWRGMADRGSVTANHFDHVHISFDAR